MSLITQKIEAAGGTVNPAYADGLDGDDYTHRTTPIINTREDGSYIPPDERDGWEVALEDLTEATILWRIPKAQARVQAEFLQEQFEAKYQGS